MIKITQMNLTKITKNILIKELHFLKIFQFLEDKNSIKSILEIKPKQICRMELSNQSELSIKIEINFNYNFLFSFMFI